MCRTTLWWTRNARLLASRRSHRLACTSHTLPEMVALPTPSKPAGRCCYCCCCYTTRLHVCRAPGALRRVSPARGKVKTERDGPPDACCSANVVLRLVVCPGSCSRGGKRRVTNNGPTMTPCQAAPANEMPDAENGASGPDENPFNRAMEDWRSRTPLLCRLLAQTICLSYVLSWLVDLSPLFACVPYQTLYKLELYRLVLSPLVSNSLLSALFACITIGDGVGPRLERSIGTASFSALVLLAIICINVSFVLLCFGAAAGGSLEPLEYASSGVWGPLLCLVAVESLSAPEETRRLLFLPIEIPRLYYPLALSGVFMLLSGPQLDLCLGVVLGYAAHYGYLEPVRPSTATVSRLETQSWLASVVCYPGYVTGRAALGSAAWVQLTQDAAWATNDRRQSGLSSLFEAFRRRSRNEPAPSRSPQFSETGGRVLGVSATPAASNVGPSVRRLQHVSALHYFVLRPRPLREQLLPTEPQFLLLSRSARVALHLITSDNPP